MKAVHTFTSATGHMKLEQASFW